MPKSIILLVTSLFALCVLLLFSAPAQANTPGAVHTVGTFCVHINIQSAIDAAASGDTIYVAGEVFTGVDSTFNIQGKALTIIGGFDDDCQVIEPGQTTLDAAGRNNSVIEMFGAVGSLELVNFIIKNGETDADGGGGIEIDPLHSVTLRNVTVSDNNIADRDGAGVHVDGGTLILEQNSFIVNNNASGNTFGRGGGVYCNNGTIIVRDGAAIGPAIATSQNNTARAGGGIFAENCDITLDATDGFARVSGNVATTFSGGGIDAFSGSTITIKGSDAEVRDNTAAQHGAGVYLDGSTLTLEENGLIQRNSAMGDGGGVYATAGSDVLVDDGRLVRNSAENGAAFHLTSESDLDASKLYILLNTATNRGSAIVADGLNIEADLTNSVALFNTGASDVIQLKGGATSQSEFVTFGGNSFTSASQALFDIDTNSGVLANGIASGSNNSAATIRGGGSKIVNCSVLETAHSGTGSGNVVADPQFIDLAAGNVNITVTSPAVDRCATGPTDDFDGDTRFDHPAADNGGIYDAGAQEATARVGLNDAACQYDTISEAIAASQPNDRILIAPGTYTETLRFDGRGLMSVSQSSGDCTSAVFGSAAPKNVIINGDNSGAGQFAGGTVAVFDSRITFFSIVIQNGRASLGGNIFVEDDADVTLYYSTVQGGEATISGGSAHVKGKLIISGGTRILTSSAPIGGAVAVDATANPSALLTISGLAKIGINGSGNSATTSGGGVHLNGGVLQILSDGSINHNSAGTNGGGVFASNQAQIRLEGGSISANQASNGGGVYMDSGQLTATTSVMLINEATNNGGALHLSGGSTAQFALDLDMCNVPFLLSNEYCSEIRGNSAATVGGAVYLSGGSFEASATALTENAAQLGSAIYSIAATDAVTLTSALIADNADDVDNAVQLTQAGSLYVHSSTFAGNSGTAVRMDDNAATATFFNSIIWDNGGGTSFVSGLTPFSVCNTTQDASLNGDSDDPLFITTTSATPNGKYRLKNTSPARDACGATVTLPTDILGNVRPLGAAHDRGAFEATDSAAPTAVGLDAVKVSAEISFTHTLTLLLLASLTTVSISRSRMRQDSNAI